MNEELLDWAEIPTEEPAPEGSKAVLMESQDAGVWLEKLDLLEKEYDKAELALATGEIQAALSVFEEIAKADPDFRDIQHRLAQTREDFQLAQWADAATAHTQAGNWKEACRFWIQLMQSRPDYGDGAAAAGLLEAVCGLIEQDEPPKETQE
jgi:tetratricopeptide (TPR) repeat protein